MTEIKKQCDCMAMKHSFVTSCHSCGWICCELNKSLIKCLKCDTTLLPPLSSDEIKNITNNNDIIINNYTIEAYELKDKLLIFDKENIKRTKVFDTQEDYYTTDSIDLFLTNDEINTINKKEEKRKKRNLLYKKHNKININLYNRSIVNYSDQSDSSDDDNNAQNNNNSELVDFTSYRKEITLNNNNNNSKASYTEIASANITHNNSNNNNNEHSNNINNFDSENYLIDYDNTELENTSSLAGSIYRSMKKRWEKNNNQSKVE